METAPSVCPHDCPSSCALEVERLAPDRIGRVHGAADHPYTQGVICAKVARYAERVHHPDRLRHPLKRVGAKGEGKFARIGWDEALDEIAERFLAIEASQGGGAVWPYQYAGTMGLVQRNSIERLRHVKRYARQHFTICSSFAGAGWLAGVGAKRGADPREVSKADLIVIWGTNAVHTQINVMTQVATAKKERNAKLVVIDTYRNPTAEKADLFLMVRPGTDAALGLAVMNVLLAEGLVDRAYMARLTDFSPDVEAHLASKTPEWAAAITGIEAETIRAFARLYGRTQKSFIRFGFGLTRAMNGAATLHALTCLPAMTGAWREEGGGAICNTGDVFAGLDQTLFTGKDALDPTIRNLDMSRIGPVLCGDKRDLGDGPPVLAMLIQNTNPMMVAPDYAKVRQGFAREDLFTVVHEQFLTETARMADIVLPATTFLEHDDLYCAYGQTFLQIGRAVIEPYAESRSNQEVIGALAKRLGAHHPGFEPTAWGLIDMALKRSGLPDAETLARARWLDCSPGFAAMHFLNGFGHKDGRFHFKPDWKAQGPDHALMPALPDYLDNLDRADAEHPFRLVTAPARSFLNSSFTETPSAIATEKRPIALLHPKDCTRLGIAREGWARLGNQQGSVKLPVRPFDGLQEGVVVVESIWPNAAFAEGEGINLLTRADPVPPNGGAAFHDTKVWIRPA
ncbi:MAG: molybdopterin oxidoreductase family protein [Rhodospirillales bacterium]|nr:molybdopterin oxidoreductase family protein [Rhodospirillales bacterium]